MLAWGGDDDLAGAAVGGVGAAFDEAGAFQVVQQVGHDGAVDAELLGQGDLAGGLAAGRGAEHLVAAGAAGQVVYRAVGGFEVTPHDRAQRQAEVELRWSMVVSGHLLILCRLWPGIRSVDKMVC